MHLEARTELCTKRKKWLRENQFWNLHFHLSLATLFMFFALHCVAGNLAPNRNALSSPSELSAACSSLNERKPREQNSVLWEGRSRARKNFIKAFIHSAESGITMSGGGVGRVVWRISSSWFRIVSFRCQHTRRLTEMSTTTVAGFGGCLMF